MIFKNNYIPLLILLIAVVILSLNLFSQISQKSVKNDFDLLNEKYWQQIQLNIDFHGKQPPVISDYE